MEGNRVAITSVLAVDRYDDDDSVGKFQLGNHK